jgi:hypothetical protein
MPATSTSPPTGVAAQVRGIVAAGRDVRGQVAQVVAGVAVPPPPEGLAGLARSVLDAAAAAIQEAAPADPESTLRQVLDGLGDGLTMAALASRLALEEAQAGGRQFAQGDLAKWAGDLRALGELLAANLAEGWGRVRGLTAGQLAALRGHAARLERRVRPDLEAALAAALRHPVRFGEETVAAGLHLSGQALGALFGAIGRRLQDVGHRLAGDHPEQ